jgi:hypothetical protein
MNSAIFTKSAKGLILASGLIAASSVVGYAQDATVALGTQATVPLSSLYASAPSGITTLGGHPFDLTGGNLVSLGNGQSASYTGSWSNAQGVYLLLNTMNTYLWYDQSPVGVVTLTFSDGTTQSTTLTSGSNIREWRIGAGNTVNWINDPATTNVWSGFATDGSAAAIDMLTISLTGSTKTITGVTVSNTNSWGALRVDLAGLTVDPVAPVATCIMPGNAGPTGPSQACGHSQADNHAKSANFTATPTAPGQLARIDGTPAKTHTKAH